MIKATNFNSQSESDFISDILITNGFKFIGGNIFRPFTDKGLMDATESLNNKKPIRPILHHYAKFLSEKYPQKISEITDLLDAALLDNSNNTLLTERKENILTTYVDIIWKLKKEEFLRKEINDQEIQTLFNKLEEARINCHDNIPPYDVQARILIDFIKITKNDDQKIELINKAINILEEGIDNIPIYISNSEILKERMIDVLSLLSFDVAKNKADEYFIENDDGYGYYTLANISYFVKRDKKTAIKYYKKSIEAKKFPVESIHNLVRILLDDQNPDYKEITQYLDKIKIKTTQRWRHLYHYALINTVNGHYDVAKNYFKECNRIAPRFLYREVPNFWMENGSRKIFHGSIKENTERYTGYIDHHSVIGVGDSIFFNPSLQKNRKEYSAGLQVRFYLGFSPRGLQAFDIEID